MNHTTQSLLEGERIAYKIIQAAKDERASKISDAQFEAKQELAMIKNEMNANYERLVQVKEKESDDLKKYEDQAAAEVKEIRQAYDANNQKVIDILFKNIMEVELTLPRVVIGNFEEMEI